MCLLLPRIIDVLNPETEIAVEFASRPLEDEENSSLTTVTGLSNPESLDAFLAQGFEVHFVLDISHKVDGLCATRIELVLKIGSFFDDGGNFILNQDQQRIQHPDSDTYLGKNLLPLVLLELRNGLLKEESSLICGGGHGW